MRENKRMKPSVDHSWDLSLDQAEGLQSDLAARLDRRPAFKDWREIRTVAAVVVGPEAETGPLQAAAVVFRVPTLDVVKRTRGKVESAVLMPFVPGLESFRLVPVIEAALGRLTVRPDALMVEGDGVAHRRGFGLACHLGLRWDLPSFGVSSVCDYGEWEDPPPGLEGGHVFLKDGGSPVGLVVRTRPYEAPVFLSIGHRMDLMSGLEILLASLRGGREPEPFLAARKFLSGGVRKSVRRPTKSYNKRRGQPQ
jgi:deoxyribonuclease V